MAGTTTTTHERILNFTCSLKRPLAAHFACLCYSVLRMKACFFEEFHCSDISRNSSAMQLCCFIFSCTDMSAPIAKKKENLATNLVQLLNLQKSPVGSRVERKCVNLFEQEHLAV